MSTLQRMQSVLVLSLLCSAAAWPQQPVGARAAEVSPTVTTAQQPAPATSKQIEQAVRAGNIAAARSAVADLENSGTATPAQTAGASLSYANQLLRNGKLRASAEPSLYAEAETHLQNVIARGSPEQQLVARNNLAASKLANGDRQTALQLLSEGVTTARALKEPAVRGQYLFNYARALERTGEAQYAEQATTSYREAFISNPRWTAAANAGGRLALARGNAAAAADFMRLLATSGHPDASEALLRAAANEPESALAGNPDIVMVLFDLLPAQQLRRAEFDDQWRPYLTSSPVQNDARARTAAGLLQLGFAPEAEIPLLARRGEAATRLGVTGWPRDRLTRPAEYFTRIGAQRAADGEYRAAYALYSAAFALDSSNIDAALYKANLLLERADTLDPNGHQLSDFVNELFAQKGEAYLGEDWVGILRFHTVLGTIFYKQKRWGESYDPRGAIFQLEHAREAKQRITNGAAEPNPPTPGLLAMLGDCYVAKNKPALAYDAYLGAADDALRAADKSQAQAILQQKLPGIPSYTPNTRQIAAKERMQTIL